MPPVVVAVVLWPLIVIEVVVRSVLRSVLAILLFGAALLYFRWRDRRSDTARGPVGDEPLATSS